MDSNNLRAVLQGAGVQDTFIDPLVEGGWTADQLGMMAHSITEFDDCLKELFDESLAECITLQQKAALRLGWKRCLDATSITRTPELGTIERSGDAQPASSTSSWSESFAPKLTSQTVKDLKSQFKKNYPSEILTQDNMPSLRLLSQIQHQKTKGDWAWIPWTFRLSAAKSDELQTQKSSRIPKDESLSLHSLLFDEPPSLEVSNNSMGLHAVRCMFETWSFGMAMVEVAHLASLKQYYLKFLQHMTKKLEVDSGLRPPTILEAQQADKALMTIVFELMQERSWSADDAIYEMSHIRSDMSTLLQPRPRAAKINPPRSEVPHGGKGQPDHRANPYPPPKGGGKKGGGKKGGKGPRVQWITETTIKGEKRQLCMRFQVGKCQLGDGCRFYHGCAYPVGDSACGKSHGALMHEQTPH